MNARALRSIGIIAIAALLVLSACDQPTSNTSTGEDSATVFGSVGFYVVDASGARLPGVTVSYTTGASSRTVVHASTDGNGWAELTGCISGDHTFRVGDGSAYTGDTGFFHVPTLDELRDAALLPVMTGSSEDPAAAGSLVQAYDGNYYVNIDIGADGMEDVFVVHPLTATIAGVAKLKTSSLDPDSSATVPPAGSTVVADFSAWHDGELKRSGTTDSTGAFTITNAPAFYDTAGTIVFSLVAADSATVAVDTIEIDDSLGNGSADSSVADGWLLPSTTRNLGTRMFVAARAPKIITYSPTADDSGAKFDPGTSSAPASLVFTFNVRMNTAKGTLTIKDNDGTPESYVFDGAWSSGDTVLTATPDQPFEYGKTITATFTGFESAEGVPYVDTDGTPTAVPHTFAVRDALTLIASNTWTAYGTAIESLVFAIGDSMILDFNAPIRILDPAMTYLSAGTTRVPASVSASGSTLTVNPTADLDYGTSYTLTYRVHGNAGFNLQDVVASTVTFTTDKRTLTLATPTFSYDSAKNKLNIFLATRTDFNNGDSSFYALLDKVTDATTYRLQYKMTTATAWAENSTALTAAIETSTKYGYYFNLATLFASVDTAFASLASGESFDFRMVARSSDNRYEAVSNSLTMDDGVAPSIDTPVTVTRTLVQGSPDNTGTATAYARYTLSLSNGEPLRMPTASDVTSISNTNATLHYIGLQSTTTIEVIFAIAAGQYTAGSTANIRIYDAAGNQYDGTTGATTVEPYQLTL